MVKIYKKHLRNGEINDRMQVVGKGNFTENQTRANSVAKFILFVGERGHL